MGIPVIEGLQISEWKHHKKALTEVGLTALISFFPLIASAIVLYFSSSRDSITLLESFEGVVSKGELVVYASSIIAPIFYLCLKDPPVLQKIPQFTFAFIIFSLCCVMYTLNYTGTVKNLMVLVEWSYWLILASILAWYLSTLFKEMTYDADLKRSEVDFANKYAAHRRAEEE